MYIIYIFSCQTISYHQPHQRLSFIKLSIRAYQLNYLHQLHVVTAVNIDVLKNSYNNFFYIN